MLKCAKMVFHCLVQYCPVPWANVKKTIRFKIFSTKTLKKSISGYQLTSKGIFNVKEPFAARLITRESFLQCVKLLNSSLFRMNSFWELNNASNWSALLATAYFPAAGCNPRMLWVLSTVVTKIKVWPLNTKSWESIFQHSGNVLLHSSHIDANSTECETFWRWKTRFFFTHFLVHSGVVWSFHC